MYLFSFYILQNSYHHLQLTLPHFLPLLITTLNLDDPIGHLISLALYSIKRIFKKARKEHNGSKDNEVSRVFEDMGGIDVCERLQQHPSEKVYKRVFKFLNQYFEREVRF